MTTTTHTIINGDVLKALKTIPDNSVHCIITSPPYWNLRNYNVDGQIGLEPTPEEYVNKIVEVSRELKRLLRPNGTYWINLGDSFSSKAYNNLKPKDLVGIPWSVAFALRDDGWWLRSDIIWQKVNAMPSSVTDRCTSSHEYIFMLAKSKQYFFDMDAIKEPWKPEVAASVNGKIKRTRDSGGRKDGFTVVSGTVGDPSGRHKRDVWSITVKGFKGVHFAIFPPDIPEICIKAGTSEYGCCPKCGAPYKRIVETNLDRLEPVEPIERKGVMLTPEDSAKVLYIEKYGGDYRISIEGDKHHEVWSNQLIKGGRTKHYEEKGYSLIWWGVPGQPDEEWKKACGADSNGEYKGESEKWLKQDELGKATYTGFNKRWKAKQQNASDVKRRILEGMVSKKTVRWEPTCSCNAGDPVPCTVLDPFLGSGTTSLVARNLNRNSIGIELNKSYIDIIKKRLGADQYLDGAVEYIFKEV